MGWYVGKQHFEKDNMGNLVFALQPKHVRSTAQMPPRCVLTIPKNSAVGQEELHSAQQTPLQAERQVKTINLDSLNRRAISLLNTATIFLDASPTIPGSLCIAREAVTPDQYLQDRSSFTKSSAVGGTFIDLKELQERAKNYVRQLNQQTQQLVQHYADHEAEENSDDAGLKSTGLDGVFWKSERLLLCCKMMTL